MPHPSPLPVEVPLGYRFADRGLIEEALRHSSFVNESSKRRLRDNERLEFLGDAVLNLVVGHILLRRFPNHAEGDLSRMRAGLVNETQLAGLARRLDIGAHLQLGRGENQTGGQAKNSILAGAFEALMAAVFLDGGFDAARAVIEAHFEPLVGGLLNGSELADFKSQLQELVQSQPGSMPRYTVIREDGPDHDKTFRVELRVLHLSTQGSGKSKKAAEQDAARQALDLIKPHDP
ncbi:MAG: ribonuclease III [Desulfobacterales bacterium]